MLNVQGTLEVQGTEANPVTFTCSSISSGIRYHPGSHGILTHTIINGCASYYANYLPYAALFIESADVTVSHLTIHNDNPYPGLGIYLTAGATVEHSTIINASTHHNGIHVTGAGSAVLASNVISDGGTGISIEAPNVILRNNTLKGGSYFPLIVGLTSVSSLTLSNNVLLQNENNAIRISSWNLLQSGQQILSGQHIWPTALAQHPIYLDYFTIPVSTTVVIPPGSRLYLEVGILEVNGALEMQGTEDQPILLSCINSQSTGIHYNGPKKLDS